MKKILFLPLFVLFLTSGLRAEDGCDQTADACKSRIKKVTPFLAELKKAQAVPALKQGPVKEPSSFAPARQAAAPAPAAQRQPEGEQTVSHPAWLLAGVGLLAGLYYFLGESKKKRRS